MKPTSTSLLRKCFRHSARCSRPVRLCTRGFGSKYPPSPPNLLASQLYLVLGFGLGVGYVVYVNRQLPGYRKRLLRRAEKGESPAQVEYSRLLLDEIEDDSHPLKWKEIRSHRRQAHSFLTQAAENGDIVAHYYLGRLHYDGKLEVSSMKAALHHFEVASEMTTAHATALAEMSEAQRLEFKRVRSDASYYLALCMLNGHGLERPLIESGMRSLQQLSAADGNPLAAFHLSEVYKDGLYLEEADYKRHLAFLKEAAQLGHLCAKQQLDDYYRKTGKKISEISGGEFEIPPLSEWPQPQ